MAYEGDAFISYAHLDNRVLSDGQTGWVASFQRALETRVAQLAGREAHVWWDPELRGNEDFSKILIDRLRKVAALHQCHPPPAQSRLARHPRAGDPAANDQQVEGLSGQALEFLAPPLQRRSGRGQLREH